MTNQNVSISIGGVDLANTPSTTVNVTQWVGNHDEYMRLCQKVWTMLTGEPSFLIVCENEAEYEDILQVLDDNGFGSDDDVAYTIGIVTDPDC